MFTIGGLAVTHTQCISIEAIFGGTMFLNMFESKMFMKQISFGTKPKPGVQCQRMSDDDDSCSSSQIWGSRDIPKSHLALTQHTRPSVPSPTYGGQKISMLWNLSAMFWILWTRQYKQLESKKLNSPKDANEKSFATEQWYLSTSGAHNKCVQRKSSSCDPFEFDNSNNSSQ